MSQPPPAPTGRHQRSLRTSVSALSERNYRLYFVGQLLSTIGTWMQTVAQSFLVLDLTHSGTALGLATAARFLPIFVLGPAGGVVTDRFDKRRLMAITQSAAGLLAGAFAVLVATGTITMWMVYLLAVALGLVNVVDKPTGQSFISELVSHDHLPSGVMLASMIQNVARVFGAALGGVCVALLGEADCFALNAASFVAVLVALAMMRACELRPAEPLKPQKGQVREGMRYVAATPELLVPLVMIAVIGTLAWEYQVSLPILARSTFHGGAALYGAMTSVMGLGAVVGGFVTASSKRLRARGLGLSAIGWGLTMLAAAIAPDLPLELASLALVGYASIAFNSLARTALQLGSSPAMRGRVMALWSVAWLGSTPVGGPIVGLVGQDLGGRWTLVVGGVPTVVCGLLAWPYLRRIDVRGQPPGGKEMAGAGTPGAGTPGAGTPGAGTPGARRAGS